MALEYNDGTPLQHDDAPSRALEDLFVDRGMQLIVEDVHGVVSSRAKFCGYARGARIVDEEIHASSGIMRSRTASAAYRRASQLPLLRPEKP